MFFLKEILPKDYFEKKNEEKSEKNAKEDNKFPSMQIVLTHLSLASLLWDIGK